MKGMGLAWILCLWIGLYGTAPAAAAADKAVLTIGYVELDGDPRYKSKRMEAQLQGQPWGRPVAGAEVALREARFPLAGVGVGFELRRVSGRTLAELEGAVDALVDGGVHFVLADLPDAALIGLAAHLRGLPVLLFNVSALSDRLRKDLCQANLLHLAPSRAMLSDALAQYLVSRKWRDVLVLKGGRDEDRDLHSALQRSIRRFGLKVVDTRPFRLGRDPRQRNRNNILLLTSGRDYDVVAVVDTDGEFAREVPYQIQRPRPVVGSAGLVPDWWHWAWERHGAPQLNNRFMKRTGRHMTGYDWAAWMGVKALTEAVVRTGGTEFDRLVAYLKGKDIVLDGFKGYRLSFRPWNGQLRQPLFLTTSNWVVSRVPLAGFLHARNNLDTLGLGPEEVDCNLGGGGS